LLSAQDPPVNPKYIAEAARSYLPALEVPNFAIFDRVEVLDAAGKNIQIKWCNTMANSVKRIGVLTSGGDAPG
jgi:hypothetical protein